MKYRVKFKFWGQVWYTEWFDTLDDAMNFTNSADYHGGIFPLAIEDENGDPQ